MPVIAFFRVSARRAKEMLREVERAVAGWRKIGRALGMSNRELGEFANAFEHPERCRRPKAFGLTGCSECFAW